MRDWWVDGSGTTAFPFITLSCCIGTGWCPKPRLVHWGMSGRVGLFIYPSDHHYPLWGGLCVLSLFIKIGLNGLFPLWSVLAERERPRLGRCKRAHRAVDECIPLLLSPTQQVQQTQKKVSLRKRAGSLSIFGLTEIEMKGLKKRMTRGSSLFRGLSTAGRCPAAILYSYLRNEQQ